MTLLIRHAVPDDRPELAAMLGEIHDYFETIPGAVQEDRPSAETLWATSGTVFEPDPFCSTLIALWDRRPAGYLAYHFGIWEVHKALFVAGLFVRDHVRGKGIGRALMDEARAIAGKRGATHVTWMVWRANAPALAFYCALGAEVFDDNVQMVITVEADSRSPESR